MKDAKNLSREWEEATKNMCRREDRVKKGTIEGGKVAQPIKVQDEEECQKLW